METIKLPERADLVEFLTQQSALFTATGWSLAAAVAAAVGPAPGSGPQKMNSSFAFTLKSLADLKIRGLRNPQQIAKYRDAWFDAGLSQPTLGEDVELPEVDWDDRHELIECQLAKQKQALELETWINNAGQSLSKALLSIRNNPIDGQHAELLTTRAERLRDVVNLLIDATTQHVQIDWDAELEKIGELP